jgi:hypothetical protein
LQEEEGLGILFRVFQFGDEAEEGDVAGYIRLVWAGGEA